MSLLDRGRWSVEVTPMVTSMDPYGTTTTPGTPVIVDRVSIQPMGADGDNDQKDGTLGVQADSGYRVMGRGPWPGGIQAVVRVLSGPTLVGRVFDQQGETRVYGMSSVTAHFDCVVKSRWVDAP